MNNKILLVVTLLLGGCATGPYAIIDGTQSKVSDENNFDVTIISIDGKMNFGEKRKNIKPGFHYINVLTTKNIRGKSKEVQMFPVDAKECMRYEVSAQHKNGISDEWDVRLLREVPILSCTPSEKTEKVVQIPTYLAPKIEVICLNKDMLTNAYNPTDLFPSIKLCIKHGQVEQAIYNYMLASAYSMFDTSRVADKTAHHAIDVIQKYSIWSLTALDQEKFQQKLTLFINTPKSMETACSFLKLIGKPNYYPDYMIEHGIKRATKENPNGLINNFKEDTTWSSTLKSQLKCLVA